MKTPRRPKKTYTKHHWAQMEKGGEPRKTDLAGIRAAYSYAYRHKEFDVHIEQDDKNKNLYWVWRM
jgi:hypothetical protein